MHAQRVLLLAESPLWLPGPDGALAPAPALATRVVVDVDGAQVLTRLEQTWVAPSGEREAPVSLRLEPEHAAAVSEVVLRVDAATLARVTLAVDTQASIRRAADVPPGTALEIAWTLRPVRALDDTPHDAPGDAALDARLNTATLLRLLALPDDILDAAPADTARDRAHIRRLHAALRGARRRTGRIIADTHLLRRTLEDAREREREADHAMREAVRDGASDAVRAALAETVREGQRVRELSMWCDAFDLLSKRAGALLRRLSEHIGDLLRHARYQRAFALNADTARTLAQMRSTLDADSAALLDDDTRFDAPRAAALVESMRQQLAQAKQGIAAAIAHEKRLGAQTERERAQANAWARQATDALRINRDAQARNALERQRHFDARAEDLQGMWDDQRAAVEHIRALQSHIQRRVETLRLYTHQAATHALLEEARDAARHLEALTDLDAASTPPYRLRVALDDVDATYSELQRALTQLDMRKQRWLEYAQRAQERAQGWEERALAALQRHDQDAAADALARQRDDERDAARAQAAWDLSAHDLDDLRASLRDARAWRDEVQARLNPH